MFFSYLNRCKRSNNCRRSKAVGDEREVGKVSLNGRVEDVLRSSVAQRRPVLVQEIHQLLRHLLGVHQNFFSFVGIVRLVCVWPGKILADLPRRKFCFADVAEVSRQVNCFALDQGS